MKQRESFSSRLGFLLISAGCAIGLGNVWRFPYITGQYGGAAFVVVYLLFCVTRKGWGWDNFLAEANTGSGLRFPRNVRFYVTFLLPIIMFIIFVMGYWNRFFA